jgi:hypothetical protein
MTGGSGGGATDYKQTLIGDQIELAERLSHNEIGKTGHLGYEKAAEEIAGFGMIFLIK